MSEPIKIVDKLTLRQEALRLSVATGTNYPISQAQQFEAYLHDDVELPEYVDPDAQTKQIADIFAKTRESFNPTPLPMWIPADSEMKPALNTQVLVMREGDTSPLFGEYLGENYWEVEDADVIFYSKDGEVNVVAWCPIPTYEPHK